MQQVENAARCLTCGKDCTHPSGEKRRYCNRECYEQRPKKQTKKPCERCGKPTINRKRPGQTPTRFCSLACYKPEQSASTGWCTAEKPLEMRALGLDRQKIKPLPVFTLVDGKGLTIWSFATRAQAEAHFATRPRGKFSVVREFTRLVACAYCAAPALPEDLGEGWLDWRTDKWGRVACFQCQPRASTNEQYDIPQPVYRKRSLNGPLGPNDIAWEVQK